MYILATDSNNSMRDIACCLTAGVQASRFLRARNRVLFEKSEKQLSHYQIELFGKRKVWLIIKIILFIKKRHCTSGFVGFKIQMIWNGIEQWLIHLSQFFLFLWSRNQSLGFIIMVTITFLLLYIRTEGLAVII